MAFAAMHLAALHLLPFRGDQISFAFLMLAPLLAALGCLWRVRREGAEGWLAMAAAMLLWASGMFTAMIGVMVYAMEGEERLSMLLFVLYGVPLIFTLASPAGDRWPKRAIDAALAAALGYLYYAYVFRLIAAQGADAVGHSALVTMFDIENLFVAFCAVLRLVTCVDTARLRFHRICTGFALSYLVMAFYINHFQGASDYGGLTDLVIDLPFLGLATAAFVGRRSPATLRRPVGNRTVIRAVEVGSPLLIPVTLLSVSALLVSHNPAQAVSGCIAAMLGYGLRTILVQMRTISERDRMAALSHLDGLTGIANRRQFDECFAQGWLDARRTATPLALLMIDIDHFKPLNDRYGHAIGDERLIEVAQALVAVPMRSGGLVARYGGEEFAVIAPGLDFAEAQRLGEAMRGAVEALALAAPEGIVTVSVGLALAQAGDDPASLLAAADAALYEAKRAGRNRVSGQPVRLHMVPPSPPADERSAAG
ncbi:sensor domain-containing diguanylate cyclase [Novosphingobium sp. 9]|uniref:GGDEF domain-containing protein n=1 Tax=Novosphingobium sp. 9 TaxID=2025349 RepID=UPI0021B5D25D|nr:GGDEF domain-containing protein [Novosphingobium sp. 9]